MTARGKNRAPQIALAIALALVAVVAVMQLVQAAPIHESVWVRVAERGIEVRESPDGERIPGHIEYSASVQSTGEVLAFFIVPEQTWLDPVMRMLRGSRAKRLCYRKSDRHWVGAAEWSYFVVGDLEDAVSSDPEFVFDDADILEVRDRSRSGD